MEAENMDISLKFWSKWHLLRRLLQWTQAHVFYL